MGGLACLWNRPRLASFADGALRAGPSRRVAAHLGRCARCRREADEFRRLQILVRSWPDGVPPEWAGFWPAVRARIITEASDPIRRSWWLPLWKPVWGHPRLTAGGLVTAGILLSAGFWLGGEAPWQAWAAPVLVQDVATSDPGGSVMVYSSQDDGVTVIWVFSSAGPGGGS
jgi:anti-sigma factor RsiW